MLLLLCPAVSLTWAYQFGLFPPLVFFRWAYLVHIRGLCVGLALPYCHDATRAYMLLLGKREGMEA